MPEADLFGLGRILHDWDEDRIRRLLGRLDDAPKLLRDMASGGKKFFA